MVRYEITKRSPVTGWLHTMEIEMDIEDYKRWQAGALIQDCLGYLPPSHREFLMTGITPEEWGQVFGNEQP